MLLGLCTEPPNDPRSWSGSAKPFFDALRQHRASGHFDTVLEVMLSKRARWMEMARVFTYPVARWRAQYQASVDCFQRLTDLVAPLLKQRPRANSVLQIGAWFDASKVTTLPCYSYHDGNAAMWYRHYGRGLLSEARMQKHLDWERSVYEGMRGIFVMSQWLKNSFVDDFGMPPDKVHVVGAGVNLPTPPVIERDWSKPRFLFVGRDWERKGGKYLLEAFRLVRMERDAELVIVGPDPQADEAGVTWAGLLSKSNPGQQAKLDALFRSATCVVLPSIYEPFGISLTEGMIYGLPCVTVDRCAMHQIVLDGETGIVAKAEDSRSLADAMLTIAAYPDESRCMGMAGRERALNNYTWDAVAGKILNAIRTDQPLTTERPGPYPNTPRMISRHSSETTTQITF